MAKTVNDDISASKIYNSLQSNSITNEIFAEVLADIKDKNGYMRLKQMVMDLISARNTTLVNPDTDKLKRASVINELCMIAFTIDTVLPNVLRMKVQQEFPKLINDILYELKEEKKINNFIPYTKPQIGTGTAEENSSKRSSVSASTSSPNSDSSMMSYEEIASDITLKCVATSLIPEAELKTFSKENKTSFQTVQDMRKIYGNVAKKRVARSLASFKPKCNSENLNALDNCVLEKQLQSITQEDRSKPYKTDSSLGNENDGALVKSSSVPLHNKKKKILKKKVLKFNETVKHLEKNSKKHKERLKFKEQLKREKRLNQQKQLKTLKKIIEKKEESEDNPVFTFFKSIAQTVTQFPPNIIAETRVKICRIIADIEAKAILKEN